MTSPKTMKNFVPKYLYTPRLVLELFDPSNPAHYTVLLASINNPTAYTRMGDFGIRTPSQFDALNHATRLHPKYLPQLQGLPITPDIDFYYIPHIGSKDGPMIGGVSVAQRGPNVPPDIGWCIVEEYMGKGYATEAGGAFLRYLREEFGLREVVSWPGRGNRESRRVAEKLGFVVAGREEEEEGDEVVYCLPEMREVREKGIKLSMWGDGVPGHRRA